MTLYNRGIILAGGLGTRLKPVTKIISKQLLPVFDMPMIYYSIATLLKLKIRKINLISDPINILKYKSLLGDGSNFNIKIQYTVQKKPGGIAQAITLSKKFIKNQNCVLILGDNIFIGGNFDEVIKKASKDIISSIFVKKVEKPNKYGVLKFAKDKVSKIIEKPKKFISKFAVTGLYFFSKDVSNLVKKIKPSKRGELEITDLNNEFLQQSKMKIRFLDEKVSWFDAGTYDNLFKASQKIYNLSGAQRRNLSDLKYLSKKI